MGKRQASVSDRGVTMEDEWQGHRIAISTYDADAALIHHAPIPTHLEALAI